MFEELMAHNADFKYKDLILKFIVGHLCRNTKRYRNFHPLNLEG